LFAKYGMVAGIHAKRAGFDISMECKVDDRKKVEIVGVSSTLSIIPTNQERNFDLWFPVLVSFSIFLFPS
jgi:hypothetical protein